LLGDRPGVALSQHDEAADEGRCHRCQNAQLNHRILKLDSAYLDDLSLLARDYPVLLGMLLFVSLGVVLANLITDIVYAWLDPRIRYQ